MGRRNEIRENDGAVVSASSFFGGGSLIQPSLRATRKMDGTCVARGLCTFGFA